MDTSGGIDWDGNVVGPRDMDDDRKSTRRTFNDFLAHKGLLSEYLEFINADNSGPGPVDSPS